MLPIPELCLTSHALARDSVIRLYLLTKKPLKMTTLYIQVERSPETLMEGDGQKLLSALATQPALPPGDRPVLPPSSSLKKGEHFPSPAAASL